LIKLTSLAVRVIAGFGRCLDGSVDGLRDCRTYVELGVGVRLLPERHRNEGWIAMARSPRDIERIYSTQEVVGVPERAQFSIEHELGDDEEEIEFQLKWPVKPDSKAEPDEGPVV